MGGKPQINWQRDYKMKKIKILKIVNKTNYDLDEHIETSTSVADGIDWHEVDDKRYKEIIDLVSFANRYRYELNADFELKIIEEVTPATVELHLEKVKVFREELEQKKRKQAEKEEKARLAREEKRKLTDIERKKKQLAKLQEELEGK